MKKIEKLIELLEELPPDLRIHCLSNGNNTDFCLTSTYDAPWLNFAITDDYNGQLHRHEKMWLLLKIIDAANCAKAELADSLKPDYYCGRSVREDTKS